MTVMVIAIAVLKPMLETAYAPGVGWRAGISAVLLVASAWAMSWAVIRRSRWFLRVFAVIGVVLTVPVFVWAAMTWINPLAGPVGTPEAPAYLGERFEIVVQEGPELDRYSVVSGSVLAIQEVALKKPLRIEETPGFDYYADARCWAVQIDMTSRFDPRIVDPDHDYQDVPLLRPTVWLSTPDGTEGTASAWERTHCEAQFSGRAPSDSYRTASPDAGVTIYSFWVTVSVPSAEVPSLVALGVNNGDDRSYFVPELTPDGCGLFDFCGGLLTLEDRAYLQEILDGHIDYYWERAVECSPPNEPDRYCSGF